MNEDVALWEESAQAWINHLGNRGDQSRQFMDPRVHRAFGDVQGKRILDIGSGEGRFTRQLAERGADVIGLEPTPKLREQAEKIGGATYIEGQGEKLPFDDKTFDAVLFYLVLIDIEPFEPALEEAFRVLKPGGRCIVVNSTSMNTASNRLWERNNDGRRSAWLVEHYGTRQRVIAEWNGIRVNNYHRPLSTYFRAFLVTGFLLRDFQESLPTEQEVAAVPDLANHNICPFFNLQVWEKPR